MPEVANVSTGKPKVTGAIFRAPIGTTLPTSATASLAGAFVPLGYVSEDGVTNSNNPETTTVKAWGGDPVLVTQDQKLDLWKMTLIEALNPNVLETVYPGSHVTYNAGAGTINVEATGEAQAEKSYVIDTALKGGAMKRIVIPCGVISEVGDIVYKDSDAIGYPVTISAMPDSSGVTHYEYIVLASGVTASISLSPSSKSIAHGNTFQLTAATVPAGGHVLYGSSAPDKATVDETGLVTAVAAGSATITAYFGGVTASCAVTVT